MDDLPADWETQDALGSYTDAMSELRRRMPVRVEHADCLEAIPLLVSEGVVVDAVVTDPPYHLVRMAERSQYPIKSAVMKRFTKGFMNTQWDGGDVAFRTETWAAIATILRPGGFLLAFGGTRTAHRMVCAIEDAGFVIQDTIAWLYGSGFPKRRDMLKPAFEPIVVAYKPGGKRTLQVDECRIGTEAIPAFRHTGLTGNVYGEGLQGSVRTGEITVGRWPANVIHDGSEEVVEAFPDGDYGQSGPEIRSASAHSDRFNTVYRKGHRSPIEAMPHDLPGSAARFFYSAKAGAQDRWGSRHPTVKPVELIRYLVKLVCPPGGLFLDPFAGSGTAGVAALAEGRRAILIEREDQYVADIRERLAFYEGEGRHSLASKARNREDKPLGGLFDSYEKGS